MMRSAVRLLLALVAYFGPPGSEAFLPSLRLQPGATARLGTRISASPNAAQEETAAVPIIVATDSSTRALTTSETPAISYDRELKLLKKSLTSFNSSAATTLLNELSVMRSNGTAATDMENLLNTLLAQGPDRPSRIPLWMRTRLLARFSQKCRMASLRRTLDITTPPPSDDGDMEDSEDQLRRRRRALVSLLRQLATDSEESDTFKARMNKFLRTPAIRIIESRARRELNSKRFTTQAQEELRSRMGQGLETPKYDILSRMKGKDGIEIRQYQPFAVCSTGSFVAATPAKQPSKDEKPQPASSSSFNKLAGYLFGKNQQQKAMKMTTPVLMEGEGSGKTMSFVLPSEFWSIDNLSKAPQPMEGSGVSLAMQDAQTRAVVMFGGYASKLETDRRKEQLMKGVAHSSEWEPVSGATIALSQYNDPFTPPWKRLNEVSIQVQRKK